MTPYTKREARRMAVLMLLIVTLGVSLLVYAKIQEWYLSQALIAEKSAEPEVVLSSFNPNTFSYEELREAGLPANVSAGIVRWRRYGKVYSIVEDLALVNGVNDSIYAVIKPYIIIDDSVAVRPHSFNYDERYAQERAKRRDFRRDTIPLTPFLVDTATVAYLSHIGFSTRQAEVFVQYRDMIGGIFNEEELRRCYVVSDSMAMRLLPHIIFSQKAEPVVEGPLEINQADTAALVKIYGIGAKSAADIIRYRDLLGGYYSVEQISEIKSVTESNFERILPQICCDSCKISKIDINFASPKELEKHPYISSQALRRIVKQRQLKGGWSRIEEMIDDEIFNPEEAERIAPYLRFAADTTTE